MTTKDCILTRRSIRKFKDTAVSHELFENIVELASYSPSWKHTQIVRYIAVEGELKDKIAKNCFSAYARNGEIITAAPMLVAVTVIKNRCGFERDGSYSTWRGDSWQMFDAGVASQTFALACHENGLGSVIMGIFDQEPASAYLEIPEDRELIALIPIGYPDEEPVTPRRKPVSDLVIYKS